MREQGQSAAAGEAGRARAALSGNPAKAMQVPLGCVPSLSGTELTIGTSPEHLRRKVNGKRHVLPGSLCHVSVTFSAPSRWREDRKAEPREPQLLSTFPAGNQDSHPQTLVLSSGIPQII